jgi:hypothetical protein
MLHLTVRDNLMHMPLAKAQRFTKITGRKVHVAGTGNCRRANVSHSHTDGKQLQTVP